MFKSKQGLPFHRRLSITVEMLLFALPLLFYLSLYIHGCDVSTGLSLPTHINITGMNCTHLELLVQDNSESASPWNDKYKILTYSQEIFCLT